MLTLLALIAFAYLAGSIPTGYWLVRALKGIDVRTLGSGSTGATNVLRAAGRRAAAFVLFFDAFKGWAPTALAMHLQASQPLADLPGASLLLIPPVVAAAALVGHSKSIFLGFQGGKSAATGLGIIVALNWAGGLTTFVLWILVLAAFRYVSLASLAAAWACPLLVHFFGGAPSYSLFCLLAGLYVTLRHRANIGRLIKGNEPRLGEKKGGDDRRLDQGCCQDAEQSHAGPGTEGA